MIRVATAFLMIVLFSSGAMAGPGVNIYGLSYFTDRDMKDLNDYNEFNYGLGLQYDLMVGERSRLFLEGGGLKNSEDCLNLHGGLSYRHQAFGPLWVGASLFVTRSVDYLDGEAVARPLPFLSLVTRPVELTCTYIPDDNGEQQDGALFVYATVFPTGRTSPGKGRGGLPDGVRQGLEFRLSPEYGLQEFRNMAFVYRRVNLETGGHRFGVEFDASLLNSERVRVDEQSSDNDQARAGVRVFWDRVSFRGSSRTVRLVSGLGVYLGHDYNSRYTRNRYETSDESEYWNKLIRWDGGLRASIGIEWRLARDITLTADSYLGCGVVREHTIDTAILSSGDWRKDTSTTHRFEIDSTGAALGVVLYFD